MKNKLILVVLATLLTRIVASSQIPVEAFAGNKKATLDIMFFKFIKNKDGQQSNFLFFNRNRTSVDYKMNTTAFLPLFGFTEAFSYNHKKLKGLAPVFVLSILNSGVNPKAGIQYSRVKKDFTLFSWVVTETVKNPKVDIFFLGRFIPKLSKNWNLFSQIELIQTLPTLKQRNFSFTQRFRFGLKLKEFQFGLGIDLAQLGRNSFTSTQNKGAFLRYEF